MSALVFWLLLLGQPATEPSLEPVLEKVERYVAEYEPQLSHCVAREEYVQRVGSPAKQVRRLTSDFLFLRVGAAKSWVGVRNVTSVDGRTLRGNDDQLKALVLASPTEAARLASAIAKDNARHNVGVTRTVNVPTLLLGWLRADVRHRLRFTRRRVESIDGVALWRIDFTEQHRPTWIVSGGHDLPSTGAIWVEPLTGRVFQTEIRNDTRTASASIRVRYEIESRLGILVPVRMQENVDGAVRQRGDATYSNYRRFGVTTTIK